MARLVDDLFELSRINAGALRLALSTVPLADVVSDAIAATAPLAASRGVTITASRDRLAHRARREQELLRVVTNLVVNSVRYTPPDGTVTIDAGRDHDDVWLAVSDTCGGIPDARPTARLRRRVPRGTRPNSTIRSAGGRRRTRPGHRPRPGRGPWRQRHRRQHRRRLPVRHPAPGGSTRVGRTTLARHVATGLRCRLRGSRSTLVVRVRT